MSDYQKLFRAVLDNVDVVVFAIDTSGVIALSDGKLLAAIDLAPGQLVGQSVFEIYRDHPEVLASVRRALSGESTAGTVELNGKVLDVRYCPLRDEGGEILGVAGVCVDATERIRSHQESERQATILKEQAELLELARDAIMVRRFDGAIEYWNRGAERLYGYSKAEAAGQISHLLLNTIFPEDIARLEQRLIEDEYWEGELIHRHRDGSKIVVSSRWVLKRDERGEPSAVLELNTDVTARKQAEEEFARKQEVIRVQALAIAELSTPLIPITEEILVMPLIGTMDSNRAQQVMESLLGGLSSSRGRFAILDITGVPVVDSHVANALLRAAHAARLLGAEVILTGIRPEVAQTLVAIDADLGTITTQGTLQSGISYALGRRPLGARAAPT